MKIEYKPLLILLILFFIIFLLPAGSSASEMIEIIIKVTDRDMGMAMEGVKVHVLNYDISGFTGPDGVLKLKIPDSAERLLLQAELIGYEPKKVNIREITDIIEIKMLLIVIEGKELADNHAETLLCFRYSTQGVRRYCNGIWSSWYIYWRNYLREC